MFKSLGGYTFALKDYYNVNLTLYLDNPFLKGVVETFDPYSIFPNLFYVYYVLRYGRRNSCKFTKNYEF